MKDLGPAFQKYNEDQLITVKLPGSSEAVIVSAHNSLGDGRYYDVENSSSFDFDHATQKASGVQSYSVESKNIELVYVAEQQTCLYRKWISMLMVCVDSKSTSKSLGTYVKEHFPNAAYGVYPIEDDSKLAIIIVGNKYSPNNFW